MTASRPAIIDRVRFFDGVRKAPFGGRLSIEQVDGMTRILAEWDRRELTDLRWLAYMLATVKWETDHRMQPIREAGSEAYLKAKKYYPYVGNGLVQVTWKTNYKKFGATKPGQLLEWPLALRALFDGMINGMFTSKKLADYFNTNITDWVGARRIINGTDKASEIAAIARQFYVDIVAATLPAKPAPISEPAPAPIPVAEPTFVQPDVPRISPIIPKPRGLVSWFSRFWSL